MEYTNISKKYRQQFIDEFGIDTWNSMTLEAQVTIIAMMGWGHTLKEIEDRLSDYWLPDVQLIECCEGASELGECIADIMGWEDAMCSADAPDDFNDIPSEYLELNYWLIGQSKLDNQKYFYVSLDEGEIDGDSGFWGYVFEL